jgi:hypothetical protein
MEKKMENETIFCPNCGNSTPSNASFCMKCGKPISPINQAPQQPVYQQPQQPVYQQPVMAVAGGGSKRKTVVIIVAVVVLVALAIVFFVTSGFGLWLDKTPDGKYYGVDIDGVDECYVKFSGDKVTIAQIYDDATDQGWPGETEITVYATYTIEDDEIFYEFDEYEITNEGVTYSYDDLLSINPEYAKQMQSGMKKQLEDSESYKWISENEIEIAGDTYEKK